MTDLTRMHEALVAADAAGDTDAAQAIAGAIRGARARSQVEVEAPYNPTDGMPRWQRAAAGYGKFIADRGRGIGQLVGAVDQGDVDEARRRDAPLMATGSGKLGNFAGALVNTAPAMFIPGVSTYAGATALGGAIGASEPVASGESRLANTVLGAAGGAGGKFVGDRILGLASRPRPQIASTPAGAAVSASPGVASASAGVSGTAAVGARGGGYTFGSVGDDVGNLTASQARIAATGTRLGMRMTPGQATGSRALQQFEAKLESQPMTSGPFNAIRDTNQGVLNRSTAAGLGERANVVDDEVLQRFMGRADDVYAQVRASGPRPINPDRFLRRISDIEAEFEGLLPGDAGVSANPLVRRLTDYAAKGEASAEQLSNLASKLGKAAHNQMTSNAGDRETGRALYQVKEVVDDLLGEGLDRNLARRFTDMRGQYRNFMLLTGRGGIVNPSSGNVNGTALAAALQKADRRGYLLGGNDSDMYQAARFAQAFKPIVGDSGTATRSPLGGPIELAASLPFNIAARAYASSPAVSAAVMGSRAAGAAGRGLAAFGTLPYYAPFALPGYGGLLGAAGGRE